jgi:hypothetical protein
VDGVGEDLTLSRCYTAYTVESAIPCSRSFVVHDFMLDGPDRELNRVAHLR